MTIAVSVKINDGVVLATDSASTVIGATPIGPAAVNIYNNANKAFNLLKGVPIGAITWGAGGIGNASISSLVKDFRNKLKGEECANHQDEYKLDKENYTIEGVAAMLRRFIYEENYVAAFSALPPEQKPALGFIVAGYSARAGLAEEYSISIDQGNCGPPQPLRRREESGISWSGMGEPLNRLVLGWGTLLPQVMRQNLGVPQQQIEGAMRVIQQVLGVQFAIPAMPLQDAIELAEFLVDVAIKYARFAPGAPVVGGPIEIAAISKHEGFKWVKRKFYFDRNLTPEET